MPTRTAMGVHDPWRGLALAAVLSVPIWAVLLFVGVLLS